MSSFREYHIFPNSLMMGPGRDAIESGTVSSLALRVGASTVIGDAGVWTPSEITTFGWWDASDSATVTVDSSEVTVWADKSGNDRDFVDGVTIAGPAYTDNALVFAGAQGLHIDSTTLFNFLHTTGGTVLVVGEFGASSNPGIDMAIVGNEWGIGSLNGYWLAFSDASPSNNCPVSFAHRGNSWIAGTWNGSSHNTNYNNLVTPQTLTQITAITDIGNATVANRYRVSVDGSDQVAANTCTGTPGTADASMTFGLGAIKYVNNVWYIHLTGKIRELVIFDSVPSTDVLAKAQGYLAHKWDDILGVTTLVTALPSGHPYKAAPPTV